MFDIFDILPGRYRYWYYDNIKPIFKPRHTRLRKAIPRSWCDLTYLIPVINFEIIKSFYEDEYKNGCVDWSSDESHRNFEQWLIESYRYITVERPLLESRLNNSYPPSRPLDEMFKPIVTENGKKMYELVDDGVPYETKYKDVIYYENKIKDKDTQILKDLIDKRDFFWT